MDTPVDSVYDIQWLKVRARNLNCASKVIELFACRENNTNVNGNTCAHIKLEQDTEWHEYIINIPSSNVATANAIKNANLTSTAWTGKINWIRLDAMGNEEGMGMKPGDQIQIDYMAFFPTRKEAEAYQHVLQSDPTVLWDFNSDGAMSPDMGKNAMLELIWSGETDDDGNDYYTFTSTGGGSCVSVDNVLASPERVQWVKIRAKRVNCGRTVRLYAGMESGISENSKTDIALVDDLQWHEYLVHIPTANRQTTGSSETGWDRNVDWIRLDPLGDSKAGDQIDIDYAAFFSTREAAEDFRGKSIPDGFTMLRPGAHVFHLGDRLVFREPWEKLEGMRAVGVGYVGREGSAAGTIAGRHDCDYFIDGRTEIELTRDYYQFWQVYTAIDNTVCVQVPTEQLRFFNTGAGLFQGVTPEVKGDYTVYEVRNNAKTNELIELSAIVNSTGTVPVWTIGSDKTRYSGQTFYFYSDVTAEENLVTLTADTTAASHADYALSGSLYTATMNLATGEPADNRIPAAYAGVVMGPSGASTDEEGRFILAPQPLVGGTTVRYLLCYNGITAIRETKIAPATAPTETVTYTGDLGGEETAEAIPVTVGAIRVHTNAAGAHFTSVEVEQVGVLRGILNVVELNGQALTVTLHTDPGGVYVYNEEAYFEHVKGVRLYFQSQLTGEIHGEYSTLPADDGEDGEDPEAKPEHQSAKLTWDPDRNVAVLNIKKLTPEEGGDFEAGDVLMAQLITDKRTMWEKMIALGDAIDHYTVDEKQLKSMVNDLRDYAKKQGYLNGAECFYINTSMQTGIFFNVWSVVQCTDWEEFWHDLKEAFTLNFYEDDGAGQMMALLEDDDRPSYGAAILAAGESGQAEYDPADYVSGGKLRIPAPVDSRWVADEGEMMAAFGAVSSKQLVEDAIQHPNSRLLPLRYESGGVTRNSNQFLLVFLSQIENSTDGTHPDVLMYSIYDANNDATAAAPSCSGARTATA